MAVREIVMGNSATNGGDRRLRELEQQLAESEQRLEDTQALAQVGSWNWELEHMSSTWTKELLRIFGRDPGGPPPTLDELIESVHPEDRQAFRDLVLRIRSVTGPFQHQYRIVDANGETRYLQAKGHVSGGPDGKPARTFGTTQDITELKRSEQDLRLRVEQQAAIAALGRQALAAPDLAGLIDEAVRMVSSVLGVELVEVLELEEDGQSFRIRAGAGWEPGTVGSVVSTNCAQMQHALREGTAIVTDYEAESRFIPAELLRRHGARSGIAAAIDCGERTYGIVAAHSTKVRHFSLEDAHFLQAVGNVLGAASGRERVEQIKAQLQQAQRLEAVGQLAGGVAHDFNNLLLVILSNAESLIAESQDEPAIAGLREIEQAAKSAAALTRQLLLFSRREPAESHPVDLHAAVRQTESLLRRTIGEHIELTVDVPAALPAVRLGLGQLDQILVNLAVNARDALPGGGTVALAVETLPGAPGSSVAVEGLSSGRPYVLLSVSDDGEGMDEDVVARAFDPFFTTKPRGQGTGLGLATVYGIVSQAGGVVEIESEPGRGTTVRVYLPVAADAQSVEAGRSVERSPRRAGTVLVVDNDEAVRTIVCRMLEKGGYRTRSAAGGVGAEDLLDGSGDIDLLLTDVLMPGVSGRELVQRVRGRIPDLPVIYMSGYSGDASSPLGPWDDGVTVLEKPFTAAKLIEAVSEELGQQGD